MSVAVLLQLCWYQATRGFLRINAGSGLLFKNGATAFDRAQIPAHGAHLLINGI